MHRSPSACSADPSPCEATLWRPRPLPSLRRSLRIVGRASAASPAGSRSPSLGSAVYGVMTVLTAWAIGKVTDEPSRRPSRPAGRRPASCGPSGWVAGGRRADQRRRRRRSAASPPASRCTTSARCTAARSPASTSGCPLRWHHRHPSGQLLSNANADVEATWNVFAPLPMALGVVVMLVFGIVQMVLVDPWLALIGLTVFPMLFLANVAFQRAMSPARRPAPSSCAPTSPRSPTRASRRRSIVKSLGREDQEAERFARGHPRAARRQHRGRPHARPLRPGHRGHPHHRHAGGPRRRHLPRRSGQLDRGRGRPGRLPLLDPRLPRPRPRLGARRAAARGRRLGPRRRRPRRAAASMTVRRPRAARRAGASHAAA